MCIIGPSLVYGGARFEAAGNVIAAVLATPVVTGWNRFIRWIKQGASTGFAPQDAATEVALTPPAPVDAVARVAAAGVLGVVDVARLDQPDVPLPDGSAFVPCPTDFVDGTTSIRKAADLFGSPDRLAQSVAGLPHSHRNTIRSAVLESHVLASVC